MKEATIGSALTKRREGLQMSRVQAAEKVGMSRTTYSSYERDEQRPSVDVFPALAAFLNVTVEEFLILYGATVVAALRPSLEHVLSQQVTPSDALAESEKANVVIEEESWLGSAAPIPVLEETPRVPEVPEVLEETPRVPEVPEAPEEPEVPKAPEVANVQDLPGPSISRNVSELHEFQEFQTRMDTPKQKKKKKGRKKKGKS